MHSVSRKFSASREDSLQHTFVSSILLSIPDSFSVSLLIFSSAVPRVALSVRVPEAWKDEAFLFFCFFFNPL